METLRQQYQEIKKLFNDPYDLAFQILNLAMIVFSALMIWRALMVYTKSESPVVVVLSGSMEPAFQRGDILFLNNDDRPVEAGEIVVFKIEGREIPIVHRVLNVHEGQKLSNGKSEPTKYLTKGDNNNIDDENGNNNLIRIRIQGKHVIITGAPPTTGRGINYQPPLPFEKNQLFQRMVSVKIFLTTIYI